MWYSLEEAVSALRPREHERPKRREGRTFAAYSHVFQDHACDSRLTIVTKLCCSHQSSDVGEEAASAHWTEAPTAGQLATAVARIEGRQ